MFSVDKQRVFNIKHDEAKSAIYCDSERGPYFGSDGCLGVWEPFNGSDKCRSNVDSKIYSSTKDTDGSSLLTGKKKLLLTAMEIEVFKV